MIKPTGVRKDGQYYPISRYRAPSPGYPRGYWWCPVDDTKNDATLSECGGCGALVVGSKRKFIS